MTAVLESPAGTEYCRQTGPFTVREILHGGPGSYRLELTGPDTPEPIVFGCHGEIAMALNVSTVQLHQRLAAVEIAAAVIAGVRRLGIGVIRERAADDRELNLRECTRGLTRFERQAKAAIWTSFREQLCIDLVTWIKTPRGL